MSALLNATGMIWNFIKGHSNPIENRPGTPGSLWEWYGIISYHPCNKHYGEYMELYEIRSIPIYECSAIIWYHYGTDPYHSHTRSYGECMELYEIRRNPIVKDNSTHMVKI